MTSVVRRVGGPAVAGVGGSAAAARAAARAPHAAVHGAQRRRSLTRAARLPADLERLGRARAVAPRHRAAASTLLQVTMYLYIYILYSLCGQYFISTTS